jgi:hypothetical protein
MSGTGSMALGWKETTKGGSRKNRLPYHDSSKMKRGLLKVLPISVVTKVAHEIKTCKMELLRLLAAQDLRAKMRRTKLSLSIDTTASPVKATMTGEWKGPRANRVMTNLMTTVMMAGKTLRLEREEGENVRGGEVGDTLHDIRQEMQNPPMADGNRLPRL